MDVCRRTVSLFFLLFLSNIHGFAQQNPSDSGNGEEAQNQLPRLLSNWNKSSLSTAPSCILSSAIPSGRINPLETRRIGILGLRKPERMTNRFGKIIGAYGILIHKVPFLHLRLPIDLNYDGIIDHHVDSNHRFSCIGDKS